jgi:hypothetical protein
LELKTTAMTIKQKNKRHGINRSDKKAAHNLSLITSWKNWFVGYDNSAMHIRQGLPLPSLHTMIFGVDTAIVGYLTIMSNLKLTACQ